MKKMSYHRCKLNIRMDMPIESWNRLPEAFKNMDGWLGYVEEGNINEGVIHWYGCNDEERHIFAYPDYNFFLLEGKMDDKEWKGWLENFKLESSKVLGFNVHEIPPAEGRDKQ